MILNGGLNSCGGLVSFDLNNKCRMESILAGNFDVCVARDIGLVSLVTREGLQQILRTGALDRAVKRYSNISFTVKDNRSSDKAHGRALYLLLDAKSSRETTTITQLCRSASLDTAGICRALSGAVSSSRVINLVTCYSRSVNLEVTVDVEL